MDSWHWAFPLISWQSEIETKGSTRIKKSQEKPSGDSKKETRWWPGDLSRSEGSSRRFWCTSLPFSSAATNWPRASQTKFPQFPPHFKCHCLPSGLKQHFLRWQVRLLQCILWFRNALYTQGHTHDIHTALRRSGEKENLRLFVDICCCPQIMKSWGIEATTSRSNLCWWNTVENSLAFAEFGAFFFGNLQIFHVITGFWRRKPRANMYHEVFTAYCLVFVLTQTTSSCKQLYCTGLTRTRSWLWKQPAALLWTKLN